MLFHSLDFVVSGIVVVGPLFVDVGNVAEDVGRGGGRGIKSSFCCISGCCGVR